jgi:hypothetical protein
VLPTVIEPLRAEWANVQAAALLLAREADEGKKREAKLAEARAESKRLPPPAVHHPRARPGLRQRQLSVRDAGAPEAPGGRSARPARSAWATRKTKLGLEGETVTLQQLRGIELNPRAAALAELVLWIGYLQWHIRTQGNPPWPSPWCTTTATSNAATPCWPGTRKNWHYDDAGQLLSRWDGRTSKPTR